MTTIRDARPTELTAVAHIFNAYLGVGSMALVPRTESDYTDLIAEERACLLVAVNDEDKVLGYASVKPWSPRGGYVLAGEVSVFLDPLNLGVGIGTQLYDVLFPRAYSLGYRYLAARIMGKNKASVRFHERHGFRTVGIQRGIGFIDGWIMS